MKLIVLNTTSNWWCNTVVGGSVSAMALLLDQRNHKSPISRLPISEKNKK